MFKVVIKATAYCQSYWWFYFSLNKSSMQVNDKKVNSIDTQNRLISVKVKDKDARAASISLFEMNPSVIYLYEDNNSNTRTICQSDLFKIKSKNTRMTSLYWMLREIVHKIPQSLQILRKWYCSSVCIVEFQ